MLSRWGLAWKIFKLKCVRAALRPMIKTHVWFVLRKQNKVRDDIINSGTANRNKAAPYGVSGPDPMMEHLIVKAKEKKNAKL